MLWLLLIWVIAVVFAFWVVDKVKKESQPPLNSMIYTAAYIIIGILALVALYTIVTTGTIGLPASKLP